MASGTMGRRGAVAVVAALLVGAAAVPAAAASGGSTAGVLAPAAVGSPVKGYTTGTKVTLQPVTCSGGTAGAYVSIPAGLTAALDVATGVWYQPPTWILAPASGVSAPSTSAACYQVATVQLDGETFGTPASGSVSTTIYPSGNWATPKDTLPAVGSSSTTTAGVSGPSSVSLTGGSSSGSTVAASVYAVASNGTGKTALNTSGPKLVQQAIATGGSLQAEHDGQYVNIPADTCVSPDVLVQRQVSALVSTWVCVMPDTQGQSTAQTVQQGQSAPLPVVGASSTGNGIRCTGGENNNKRIPSSLLAEGMSGIPAQMQWCANGK